MPDVSFPALADAALRAVPGLIGFFKFSANFLFEPDTSFSEGVAALYAYDPTLATYLIACRSDWLTKWIQAGQNTSEGDVAAVVPDSMSTTLERIAAMVENICIHLLSRRLARLAKSLVIVEVPKDKRNPVYQRRFDMVLATDGVTPLLSG